MKLPYSWLRDFVDVSATPHDYAHLLTMTGSKVEAVHTPAVSGVIAAKIIEVKDHAGSDHLKICILDDGSGTPVQVVSGAPNLSVGDVVPLAVAGAKLPEMEIKSTVMRGEKSDGMLCSFQELGLTQSDCPYAVGHGILVFPPEMGAVPGDDALKLLGLNETVIEFEITPNRPDCLSVIGLARETAASYALDLRLPEPKAAKGEGDISEHLSVEIANPELCLRYSAGMVRDIKIEPSPAWMRHRLRNAGIRPINNIVDITNYVCLEYGQPMHAFDYSCISQQKIIVRAAKPMEKITTLDGQARELTENTLLITDPEKPIGIAGVMGGENSEITDETKMIVFESACFSGPSVRNAARNAGMRTEASSRFEKGLDAENTMPALLRALELVEELGAGRVIGGLLDVYPKRQAARTLPLDCGFINGLLGVQIERGRMEKILESLGFSVQGGQVTIPSWRGDIEGQADLAEEAGRIYGFDNIPSTLFASRALKGGFNELQNLERALGASCRACGFFETRSLSFMNPKDFDKMGLEPDDSLRNAVKILNPLGEENSLMRTTLLPALLTACAVNRSFSAGAARLYEIAQTYHPDENLLHGNNLPDERKTLGMAAFGDCDFFEMKGILESVLADAGVENPTFDALTNHPSWHPGRTALVKSEGEVLGIIGQIHPQVCENFHVDLPVFGCEISVLAVKNHRKTTRIFTPGPKFPASLRDLAVICDNGIPAGHLAQCIRAAGGETLENIEIFDVYTGPQVGSGKKSVAFALSFRKPDATLSDSEIDVFISDILSALEKKYSAALRK